MRARTLPTRTGFAAKRSSARWGEATKRVQSRSIAMALVAQVGERAENAAERRTLVAKMEACKAAMEDVVRILSIDEELRHEQSGDRVIGNASEHARR